MVDAVMRQPLRRRRSLALALAVAVIVAASGAWAGEPTDAMRDFFAAVNLVLGDTLADDQPLGKLRAIRRHVDEVFDFREAAMLALGREWTAHTEVEQNEFVVLFADLLERSFVWRVAGKASLGGGVKVQYLGESVAGDTATVDTAIAARDGSLLRLEYRMVRRLERWVVRDVVMDGVSTMENYHAQFQRVVRDSSWRDLMAQLRAKVGAPPAVEVAAAPTPVVSPVALSAASIVAPLTPPDLSRPAVDERQTAARDLAAVVTPGLAVRDVGLLPVTRPRAPVVAGPAAAPTAPHDAPAVPTIAREGATAVPSVSATPPRALAAVPPPALAPPGNPKPALARTAVAPAAYWIQVGAFRNATVAGRIAARVNGEIFVVAGHAAGGGHGEPLLRVRVGPFNDRAQASARLRELRAQGYQPFVAVP
jgi:ABC-type transporter MlaC component/cell division septation protein DedD